MTFQSFAPADDLRVGGFYLQLYEEYVILPVHILWIESYWRGVNSMTLFWIAFTVFALTHLTACYKKWTRTRKITKAGLVPLLMLGVYLSGTNQPLLYLGLALGWLGDIFLMLRGKRCFILGAVFFALGHFSYIAATLRLFLERGSLQELPLTAALLFLLLIAGVYVLVARKIRNRVGSLAYLGAVYFTVLTAALVMSLIAGNYLLAVAFAVFMVSDTTLSVSKFFLEIRHSNVYVMVTYILAQVLICLSFMPR